MSWQPQINRADVLSHSKSIGYSVYGYEGIPSVWNEVVTTGDAYLPANTSRGLAFVPSQNVGSSIKVSTVNGYPSDSVKEARRLWVIDTATTQTPSANKWQVGFGMSSSFGDEKSSYLDLTNEELSIAGTKFPLKQSLKKFSTVGLLMVTNYDTQETILELQAPDFSQIERMDGVLVYNKSYGILGESTGESGQIAFLHNSRSFNMGFES